MAELIENWLGNPIARKALGFFTKRDKDGRRIEKILKKYTGEEVNLTLGDRISYSIVKRIIKRITIK